MNTYQIPWLFYMDYQHLNQKIEIKFSYELKQRLNFPYEIMHIEKDELTEVIHKYDFRKLAYFADLKAITSFDTLMRFKFNHQKGYIKTQAICEITPKGFSCVHIEVLDIIKTKKKVYLDLFHTNDIKITLRDDQLLKEKSSRKLQNYKNQLQNILQR